jgi:hypothetical protein
MGKQALYLGGIEIFQFGIISVLEDRTWCKMLFHPSCKKGGSFVGALSIPVGCSSITSMAAAGNQGDRGQVLQKSWGEGLRA